MEITYEKVSKWFDMYFEEVSENMGPLDKVPKLAKLFTEDFEFIFKSDVGFKSPRLSRDEFLVQVVHPGVVEKITPLYYVIDMKRMITVAHLEHQISDASGKLGRPFQTSIHYHFVLDENKEIRVKKIFFWAQTQPPEDVELLARRFTETKEQAFTELAINYIKSNIK